ncbi:MAG: ferredoxin [Myxococcota bacterium]
MKVHVDLAICVGHGRCYELAPEVFDESESRGHCVIRHAEIPPELEDQARRAVENCPEQALRSEEG